ncbi:MAG: hypothetical protein U5L96_06725 [Owenweeksia sp.]|nr:hypothetical protein [Owenweeksia sp.]
MKIGINLMLISNLKRESLDQLSQKLLEQVHLKALDSNENIVTNERHYHALQQNLEDIQ